MLCARPVVWGSVGLNLQRCDRSTLKFIPTKNPFLEVTSSLVYCHDIRVVPFPCAFGPFSVVFSPCTLVAAIVSSDSLLFITLHHVASIILSACCVPRIVLSHHVVQIDLDIRRPYGWPYGTSVGLGFGVCRWVALSWDGVGFGINGSTSYCCP